jgi:hypothetical protein
MSNSRAVWLILGLSFMATLLLCLWQGRPPLRMGEQILCAVMGVLCLAWASPSQSR